MNIENKIDLFSRENSLVMRGLAIMAIMYHNLLHSRIFGFSVENEMSFSNEKVDAFLFAMSSGRCWGADIVSFLGWLGVPVFVFLTGYGLSRKYPPQQLTGYNNPKRIIQGKCYLRHSYMKLFLLMLPAVLFFALADVAVHEFADAGKKLFSLTLLSNFDYPDLHYSPGVYWYFSLTFQLYVLFYLLHNWFTGLRLFMWSVISLIVLTILVTTDYPWLLSVYRHCFTGWLPLFALGIWLAQKHVSFSDIGWLKSLLLVMITGFLVVVMSFNQWIWVVVPIVALVFFMALTSLFLKIPWLCESVRWVGCYSAFIFVCHPIARVVANRLNGLVPLWGIIIVFFLMTMILAIIYRKLYNQLLRYFIV